MVRVLNSVFVAGIEILDFLKYFFWWVSFLGGFL